MSNYRRSGRPGVFVEDKKERVDKVPWFGVPGIARRSTVSLGGSSG
jgi:hypothetical protein